MNHNISITIKNFINTRNNYNKNNININDKNYNSYNNINKNLLLPINLKKK